jgi:hypothetical protein
MAAFLLHQGATVLCAHAGQAQPTVVNPRVKVGGQPVVTQAAPFTIAGCPFMAGTTPMPCVTAQWTVAAVRVKAGGQPVLLQNSQAVCAPNGTPVNIVVTQVRVKGT